MGRRQRVSAELGRSLNAKLKTEALPKYHILSAELEQLFKTIRTAYAATYRAADQVDLKQLAQSHLNKETELSDAEFSVLDWTIVDRQEIKGEFVQDFAAISSDDPAIQVQFVNTAEVLMRVNGFHQNDNQAKQLAGYIRRAEILLTENTIELVSSPFGDPLPAIHLFPASEGSSVTMGSNITQQTLPQYSASGKSINEAYDEFIADNSRHLKAKSLDVKIALFKVVSDCMDCTRPISMLGRSDVRNFLHVIERMPPNRNKRIAYSKLTAPQAAEKAVKLGHNSISQLTVKQKFTVFVAFLSWAVAEEYLDKNPAKELFPLAYNPAKKVNRQPFSLEELKVIFDEEYYDQIGIRVPDRSGTDKYFFGAKFWAPLISLFTGMRVREICQLTKAEIICPYEIYCIKTIWDIDNLDDEVNSERVRSFKNKNALRTVPLHRKLIELGFIDFVNTIAGGNSTPLFPELKPDAYGNISRSTSDGFNRYLEVRGNKSPEKVFHSFRHTFRRSMGRYGVNRDVIRDVGGWSGSGSADDYGDGQDVFISYKEICKIQYESLDLFHLNMSARNKKLERD